MENQKNFLTTAPYKGTRDFYPEEMRLRNWMFSVMRETVLSFGYEEYDGPILESFDLYKAKSGEEIVERQLYDFIDKGERRVAIRPEMTPTLARMVAGNLRNLPKPVRWFSIPNLWRYEQPGKGRLREHWQLNVDLFGVDSYRAELEILLIADSILKKFGAPVGSYQIKVSHRKLLDSFLKNSLKLNGDQVHGVSKLLDKKSKISPEVFETEIKPFLNNFKEQFSLIKTYLDSNLETVSKIPGIDTDSVSFIRKLFQELGELGIDKQLLFDPSIIRGFDYYTGCIFEVFDTNPENRRSLYGGGRYDNLIGLFSKEQLSGIGFGLGDVTLKNFLEGHHLIPNLSREKTLFLPIMDESLFVDTFKLSKELRENGILTETMLDSAKIGKQIQIAEKKGYRYVLFLGESEIRTETIQIKDLISGEQKSLPRKGLSDILKKDFQL
ncbi:histidine--tRNA ligase [Leptospira kirschneri str. 200803703]|uniref:Histidine--tRNA ligase n=1 Tax=Leptospira kirschneri str. 200802841 TaxID=1193047 RepID=A0A828Y0K7_9LEPT|nr:histidine--tRNA ligase [Leptospira kirschneri]EMO74088.1 histidine--tRNA ligase [Leptospira kirschneri str. 200801925]EJO69089.1 histidine--tRNA ligase [Leptospira kirschneri serovar Grippotyphosa str. RM52]EKO53497.1 histidine--tRNA ligase [Leptospira kirschneri str. 200802841]EKP06378.1 histidine--tRNA ligase [Leptospira kirschneri str. 2008720114]EKR08925.1 histidine--tRNA ligase [Leptospira kirschneri serovar Valbuzzi str. 200702274]